MTITIIVRSEDGENRIEKAIDYTEHSLSCLREHEIDRIVMDHVRILQQTRLEGGADKDCTYCDGTGTVRFMSDGGMTEDACGMCDGSGKEL